MLRRGPDGSVIAGFDQTTRLHHEHAISDIADDRKVVRDEEQGEPEFGLEVGEKIENLRLDGYIQRGHRLVADHKFRFEHEGSRNAYPLSLATRKFVRVAV